jgi:hypothetical protein
MVPVLTGTAMQPAERPSLACQPLTKPSLTARGPLGQCFISHTCRCPSPPLMTTIIWTITMNIITTTIHISAMIISSS